jgi:hypothetical protein
MGQPVPLDGDARVGMGVTMVGRASDRIHDLYSS